MLQHNYNPNAINFSPVIGHIYSFILAISILVVIFASWLKMYKRNIPTKTLEWSAIIVVFAGLIGARIWYALNNIDKLTNWYSFIDWSKGGLAIQGAVFVGFITGFIIFYRASLYYRISMWVYLDCILPNLLLGQAIGRWGNFFNQEVLGHDHGAAFSFLPSFINNYLHYDDDPIGVYRHPLFLYESIATFSCWVLITFIIGSVGFSFGKKPWEVEPKKYQIIFSLQVKPTKKHYFQQIIRPWQKIFNKMKQKKAAWIKAYYEYEPSVIKKEKRKPTKLLKITPDLKWKEKLKRKIINNFRHWINPWFYDAKELNQSYNPHNYHIVAAGVCGSLYFVFYGIIRIILEPLRAKKEIMTINGAPTSMIIALLWIIIGIIMIVLAQYITKNKLRKKGWFYERQY